MRKAGDADLATVSRLKHERLGDLAFAVVAGAVAVATVVVEDPYAAYDFPEPNVWLILLALVGSLPLAVRVAIYEDLEGELDVTGLEYIECVMAIASRDPRALGTRYVS